ncbi:MAG: hypothetical protein ACRDIE_16640 [Chloroflexota bacterium]
MELTESLKGLCKAAAQQLRGSARRLFMARTMPRLTWVSRPSQTVSLM